jgi:hypothetical protein
MVEGLFARTTPNLSPRATPSAPNKNYDNKVYPNKKMSRALVTHEEYSSDDENESSKEDEGVDAIATTTLSYSLFAAQNDNLNINSPRCSLLAGIPLQQFLTHRVAPGENIDLGILDRTMVAHPVSLYLMSTGGAMLGSK